MTDRDGERVDVLAMHRKAFGARLRAVRRSLDVTQDELADRARIRRTHISKIEAGTQNLTIDTMWRLAHGLGVHVADLIDDRRPIGSVEVAEPESLPE